LAAKLLGTLLAPSCSRRVASEPLRLLEVSLVVILVFVVFHCEEAGELLAVQTHELEKPVEVALEDHRLVETGVRSDAVEDELHQIVLLPQVQHFVRNFWQTLLALVIIVGVCVAVSRHAFCNRLARRRSYDVAARRLSDGSAKYVGPERRARKADRLARRPP